jgi:hypothetical protein
VAQRAKFCGCAAGLWYCLILCSNVVLCNVVSGALVWIVLMREGNLVVFIRVVLIQTYFFLCSTINVVFITFIKATDFYLQFPLFLHIIRAVAFMCEMLCN